MAKRFFVLALAALLALLTGCPKPPAAANSADAKRLVEIGDYAQALPKLLELSKAEPENIEVRLLMARSFAECGQELAIPGLQSVGTKNTERAVYQFQVLAKLGDEGQAMLRKVITDGDKRLAPLAVEAAGHAGSESAIDAIGGFLKRAGFGSKDESTAVSALVAIGGNKAAAVIKMRLERTTDTRNSYRLAKTAVLCYDSAGRLKLARETTNQKLLYALVHSAKAVPDAETTLTILIRRDYPDAEMGRSVQLRAASELWQIAPEAVIEPLAALCAEGSAPFQKDCRDRLKSALGFIERRDQVRFLVLLEKLTAHEVSSVRWFATEWLLRAAPEKAVVPLCKALDDPTKARNAVWMLQRTKSRRALGSLFEALEARTDPDRFKTWAPTREQLCSAIIGCGAKSGELVRTIRLMMKPNPDAHERSYRMQDFFARVASVSPGEQEGFVAALLADKNADLRRHGAVNGLQRVPIGKRVELAQVVINDPEQNVRTQAIRALREGDRLGLLKADKLIPLLRSDHKDVVRWAAQALSKEPAKAASKAMFELLKDSTRSKYAMRELAMFFEKVPDKRAADAFAWEIVSKSPAVPVETLAKAVKACAADLPASAKEIARALQDKAHGVRMNAVKALGILADKSVLPDVFKALRKAASSREKRALNRLIESLGGDPSQPDEDKAPDKKTEDA